MNSGISVAPSEISRESSTSSQPNLSNGQSDDEYPSTPEFLKQRSVGEKFTVMQGDSLTENIGYRAEPVGTEVLTDSSYLSGSAECSSVMATDRLSASVQNIAGKVQVEADARSRISCDTRRELDSSSLLNEENSITSSTSRALDDSTLPGDELKDLSRRDDVCSISSSDSVDKNINSDLGGSQHSLSPSLRHF